MAGWLPKKKCWPRTCLLLSIDSYYSSVTAQHIGDCLYVYVICWPLPFCHATQNPKRSNTNGKWTVFNYNVGKYFGMSSVCVCVCSYNWIRALANRADQVTERPTHQTRHRPFHYLCHINLPTSPYWQIRTISFHVNMRELASIWLALIFVRLDCVSTCSFFDVFQFSHNTQNIWPQYAIRNHPKCTQNAHRVDYVQHDTSVI